MCNSITCPTRTLPARCSMSCFCIQPINTAIRNSGNEQQLLCSLPLQGCHESQSQVLTMHASATLCLFYVPILAEEQFPLAQWPMLAPGTLVQLSQTSAGIHGATDGPCGCGLSMHAVHLSDQQLTVIPMHCRSTRLPVSSEHPQATLGMMRGAS